MALGLNYDGKLERVRFLSPGGAGGG